MSDQQNPVVSGVVMNMMPYVKDVDRIVSFRALLDYRVGTDDYILRFDIKIGGVQANVGLHVRPTKVRVGAGITSSDELMMPRGFPGFAACVAAGDLIASLRGLADRLEHEVAECAKKAKP